MKLLVVFGLLIPLAACSSIIEGSSQNILINTNPSGAKCALYRKDINIGTIDSTPSSILVKKTKDDVTVICVKEGYQQASYFNHSGVAGATVANVLLGGGIGWAVDSISGADNKYDSPVNITLVLNPPGSVETEAKLPPTLSASKFPVATASPPKADVTAAAPEGTPKNPL